MTVSFSRPTSCSRAPRPGLRFVHCSPIESTPSIAFPISLNQIIGPPFVHCSPIFQYYSLHLSRSINQPSLHAMDSCRETETRMPCFTPPSLTLPFSFYFSPQTEMTPSSTTYNTHTRGALRTYAASCSRHGTGTFASTVGGENTCTATRIVAPHLLAEELSENSLVFCFTRSLDLYVLVGS